MTLSSRRTVALFIGAGVLSVATSGLVGYYSVASAGDEAPIYPETGTGQTYGTLPADSSGLDLADAPDLVRVVGDHGVEGYASSADVLGKDEAAPESPATALAEQETSRSMQTPVYAVDGVTVVDTFTIGGHDLGGVELQTVP